MSGARTVGEQSDGQAESEPTVDGAQEGGVSAPAAPDADGAEGEVEQPTQAVRDLFGLSFPAVSIFAEMLESEGELRGLIGPHERQRLWSRHIVNSAAVLPYLPSRGTVLDIGSGAGFPGLVIAMARPDLNVVLIEPMQRRCEWLSDVIEATGLDNCVFIPQRADDLKGRKWQDLEVVGGTPGLVEEFEGRIQGDAVTSRAVANMAKLVRMTSKLIKPKGRLVALKGRRAAQEVDQASAELKRHHLSAVIHQVPSVMEDESTFVVECRRV